jgi:hypothetical protein
VFRFQAGKRRGSQEGEVKKWIPAVVLLLIVAVGGLWAQDAQANGDHPVNVAGTWQMSWQGRRGNEQGTLKIQQDGSKLSGTFDGPRGSSALSGSVQGNQVTFSVQMNGRRTVTLVYSGTLDGDKMSGAMQRQGGEGGGGRQGGRQNQSWSATRQQVAPGSQSRPDQDQDGGDQDGF